MSVSGFIVMWQVAEMSRKAVVKAWATAFPGHSMPDLSPTQDQAVRQTLDAYVQANPEMFWRQRAHGKWCLWAYKAAQVEANHDQCVPILQVWTDHSGIQVRDVYGNDSSRLTELEIEENPSLVLLKRVAGALAKDFKRRRDTFSATDMSAWLIDVAVTVAHGAKLRNGVYFVPAEFIESWREICRTLRHVVEHSFFEVPVAASAQLDEVVADAIVRQVDETIARFATEMDGGEEQRRSFSFGESRSRESKRKTLLIGEVDSQLSVYEKIFEDKQMVVDRLLMLRAKLASTMIEIEEEVKS